MYRFKLTLEVGVEAPTDFDAKEIIEDVFGVGDNFDIHVENLTIKPLKS